LFQWDLYHQTVQVESLQLGHHPIFDL